MPLREAKVKVRGVIQPVSTHGVETLMETRTRELREFSRRISHQLVCREEHLTPRAIIREKLICCALLDKMLCPTHMPKLQHTT